LQAEIWAGGALLLITPHSDKGKHDAPCLLWTFYLDLDLEKDQIKTQKILITNEKMENI